MIWFGVERADEAEVRARSPRAAILADGGSGVAFTLEVAGAGGVERSPVELPLHGLYNVANALAAAAVGHALGLGVEEIARGLARVRAAAHRGAVHRIAWHRGGPGAITLIDDSYNSNPDALERALESAAGLVGSSGEPPAGRRVAILGDMLELGPDAPRFHRDAGCRAAELGFGPVVGVGALAGDLVAAARDAGCEALHLEGAAEAADWAAENLRPGDLVLVKGSRGVGLDAVVERLLTTGGEGEA